MPLSVRNLPQRRRSLGSVSPKRIYRNLSVRLKGGDSNAGELGSPDHHRRSASNYKSLWEAVENEDILAVKGMLTKGMVGYGGGQKKETELRREREKGVNSLSEQGLVPLDVAALTHNSPLLRILVKAGARHNPCLSQPAEWSAKLDALVALAGEEVAEWRESMLKRTGSSAGPQGQSRAQWQLRVWTLRQQLYRRMRDGFHLSVLPGPPSGVSLLVSGASSLSVSFREPAANSTGLVTRYRVEWSTSASFQPLGGSALVPDTMRLSYSITGLQSGQRYFVRVSAYNVKGWGPAKSSRPVCAAPSSWMECDNVKVRSRNQSAEVKRLLKQIRETQFRGDYIGPSRQQGAGGRRFGSRGLKHLFHSATKFVRLLQRGVYLATVFYHKKNILVTSDGQLPLVEIQSCSTSVTQDFLWFAKLSCAWQQVPWLQKTLSSSLSCPSSLLQNRQSVLEAVAQLQSYLGTVDLGQVFYEPLKDRHGNVLLVTMRECESLPPPSDPSLHWSPLFLLDKNKNRLPEPTAIETLTEQLKEKLSYHRHSIQQAQPGLYVGVLKLCSSVEQIRVLVAQKLPNLLCHARVRHNPHVSREEWAWLQSLSVIGPHGSGQSVTGSSESLSPSGTEDCGLVDFVRSLRAATTHLLTKLSIPLHKAYQYRVYTQELLRFGDGLSLLLLLPPSEDFSASSRPVEGVKDPGLAVPLQIFELVHFWAYEQDFLSHYCQAWVCLELDSHLSQQALREALDGSEVQEAKDRLSHVTQMLQGLEAVWREMRWITDALQCIRSKHGAGTVSLGSVMGEEPAILATNGKDGTYGSTILHRLPPSLTQRTGSERTDLSHSGRLPVANGSVGSASDIKDNPSPRVGTVSGRGDAVSQLSACSPAQPEEKNPMPSHRVGLRTDRQRTDSGELPGDEAPNSLRRIGFLGQAHDCFRSETERSAHINRYLCDYGLASADTASCPALGDVVFTGLGNLGGPVKIFAHTLPSHARLEAGAAGRPEQVQSLPARSQVEWVSSSTPEP